MPRHYLALQWGIPEPYTNLTNPLPRGSATLERGAAVYAQDCIACHGSNGVGNGEAGRRLSPPPGNLVWLSDVPEKQWDPFMYWTIAEGGGPLGTAMPAFKDKLSKGDIWAVTAYIQENLPFVSRMR
jgi:mono/diheme cytochrome c family protein